MRIQIESQGKELTSYMENLHKEISNFVQNKKSEKQQMFADVQTCLKKQESMDMLMNKN